jgi:squalene synthase HpnC
MLAAEKIMNNPAPPITQGKTDKDESFPVAMGFLPKEARRVVMAFYKLAREADDIADHPSLPGPEKVKRLAALDAVLAGGPETEGTENAARYLQAIAGTKMPVEHPRHLLIAFTRDSERNRCQDWEDLIEYCRFSANPVGRFLLDLLGAKPEARPASDHLCTALQILNHMQDVKADYLHLNRIYLPQDWLTEAGVAEADLKAEVSTSDLRHLIDRVLDKTERHLEAAEALPGLVDSLGLRMQAGTTLAVSWRLLHLLKNNDPLRRPIKLSKLDWLIGAVKGFFRGFFP